MDQLKTYTDQRGSLTVAEIGQQVPFEVSRVFWIHHVPQGQERGKHANWISYEYLVVMCGSVEVYLEDKEHAETYYLSSLDQGLVVPPGTWTELRNFSEDAVLMVLASGEYRPDTYINSYEQYLELIGKR